MIYELRSYEVVPGRMPAMHARFQNHTLGFFTRHGIRVVGFWEAIIVARIRNEIWRPTPYSSMQ